MSSTVSGSANRRSISAVASRKISARRASVSGRLAIPCWAILVLLLILAPSSILEIEDIHVRSSPVGDAQPSEDLPALGQVPIAERRTRDCRIGRPRAPAQHLVSLVEEDLGVLTVREAPKPGIRT